MIQIINNDCLIALRGLPDNSVDSVVTDPPYGISFMNKHWDYDVPKVDVWKEVFRVLKPGGHLLSFGGTRTYHRMVVNIEDAGFEIRDQIQWLYGCLSEDTEILTKKGWVQYHISKEISTFVNDEILIYDVQNDIYKWEKPERWNEYNIIQDTAYHIQSDYTDQIVSRNHRCLVKRKGNLVFIQAERLANLENMPTLPDNIFEIQKRQSGLLQSKMQRVLQRNRMGENRMEREFRCKPGKKKSISYVWRKESCMERWNNLQTKERVLCGCKDKVHCLSESIYTNGTKGWICDGIQTCDGNSNRQTLIKNRMCSSYRSQPTEQRNNKSDAIHIQSGSQVIRGRKTYNTSLATVTPIEYSGVIFCPTVSTGAFVARRNNKIFITGNSGFPKSLSIGKAVDELQGNIREKTIKRTIPYKDKNRSVLQPKDGWNNNSLKTEFTETKGTSEYKGWGTALKPANEPICLARKPLSEKTVASNVLKWGTGGINIDGCRVDLVTGVDDSQLRTMNRSIKEENNGWGMNNTESDKPQVVHPSGRFPANVIHDGSDEVESEFAKAGILKSGKAVIGTGTFERQHNGIYGSGHGGIVSSCFADMGSASRFFYCAKASKNERNKGMDKNNHPTVKPVSLMRYLCKLITPPKGTILDPYMGSGSTGIGAKVEGFNFIGIERETDYCKIAQTRIDAWEEEKPPKPKVVEPTLF